MGAANKVNFRNRIATVNDIGGRAWVYINKPMGNLHNKRILVSLFLLAIYFSFPFIKVNGDPFILFNFFERKFIVLGQIFWPQDFHLFVIAMITGIVAIILFTVIYGRVWCGWLCPQTIFMEMVFRKIDFWIIGNAREQKKFREGTFTLEKLIKGIAKHSIYIIISVLISHTALSYLVSIDEVKLLISEGPRANFSGFTAIVIFTILIYGVFAFFREQVCVLVCPYGRLQSVLLDSNSLMVSYDYMRGEPKANFKKDEDRKAVNKGDCIDCNNCVTVCPTGIDIRNGTQMECINCTACIDACNKVMGKLKLPKGLIRITSENAIKENSKFKFTSRIIAYTTVLFLLLSSFVITFSSRTEVESTILRAPGTLYNNTSETIISNLYTIKSINKSRKDLQLKIELLSPNGNIQIIGSDLLLKNQDKLEAAIIVEINTNNLQPTQTEVVFGIYADQVLIEKVKTTFLGPENILNLNKN